MSSAPAIPLLVVVIGFVAACLTVLVRGAPPRYLPKWAWALVICAAVPWGGLAYLAFGRTGKPGIPLDTLAPIQPHDPGEPSAVAPQSPPAQPQPVPSLPAQSQLAPPQQAPSQQAPPLLAHRRPAAGPVVIEVDRLAKRFGPVTAVDGLSFAVQPGKVTGFLGPNGAGKTTTMRLILGLDSPTAGTALIAGHRYRDIVRPLHEVGSLLDATAVHRGRTAWFHLLALARSNGIGQQRVREVLRMTGLEAVAGRRVGEFSLGMKQRLGIAAALMADPAVLLLDEPVNGLDLEGVRWIRQLLTHLAADGRTVLVSSHLMSEMAMIADHLIIIGRGRLLADTPAADFVSRARRDALVKSPRAAELGTLLTTSGATVSPDDAGGLAVTGMDAPGIGELAAAHGIALHELVPRHASLEDAYLDLTSGSADYHSLTVPAAPAEGVAVR
jgi:ABC-2 type transport system ATP-binding protein